MPWSHTIIIERLTFESRRTPSKEVEYHTLTHMKMYKITNRQATLVPTIIFTEDILKILRLESALIVIGHTVAPMFVLMDPVKKDPEEWVWQKSGTRWIRQSQIDEQCGDQRERRPPAESPETDISVPRPDDIITISIPVIAVLLEDCAVSVDLCVVQVGRAFG